jgi:type II secretory pathway pseudopilin PulG
VLKLKKLGVRGDTILEVLLCIAIVGATLGGAFVSARRSFAASRRAQERGEALKYVETQLELLKTAAASHTSNLASSFCLNDALARLSPPCALGPGGRYKVTITRTGAGPQFTVTAVWDRFGEGTQDRIEMNYLVYQL